MFHEEKYKWIMETVHEEKDITTDDVRAINEINTGVLALPVASLQRYLPKSRWCQIGVLTGTNVKGSRNFST